METNFRHKEREEQQTTSQSEARGEVEFATSEEAIRADIAQNPPPPEIAERLNESLAQEPKRGTSFWTKLGFRK